jgi:hypothetical protein
MQPFSGTLCPTRRSRQCDLSWDEGVRCLLATALPAISPLRDWRSHV